MPRFSFVLAVTLASISLVTGCTTAFEPKPVEVKLEGPKILSSTASVRNTFIMDRDTSLIVCAEPPPDAAFSQDTDMDISLSLIMTTGSKGGDDDDGSEESEMAGRSPSVLLARELMFRFCEFSRNYHVDRDAAIELYKKNLDIIREVGGKETEHTTVKIGDRVTNAAAVTVDKRSDAVRSSSRNPFSTDRKRSSNWDSDDSSNNSSSSGSSDDDY